MNGVILAAGRGRRLGELTALAPKCMLEVEGRTLLDWSASGLRRAGCASVYVVTGHGASHIVHPGTIPIGNPQYWRSEVAASLLVALERLDGTALVCYSDIWLSDGVFAALADSRAEIGLLTDPRWRRHYSGRDQHPVSEAELAFHDGERVHWIGKGAPPARASRWPSSEFLGAMRLSGDAVTTWRAAARNARQAGVLRLADGRRVPWGKLYLTHVFQSLVDAGHDVRAIPVVAPWGEVDTPQDLGNVRRTAASLVALPTPLSRSE